MNTQTPELTPTIQNRMLDFYNNNENSIRSLTTGLDMLSLFMPTLLPLAIAANAYGAYGNYNQYKNSGNSQDLRELAFNGLGLAPGLGAAFKIIPNALKLPKLGAQSAVDSMKFINAINKQKEAKATIDTMMAANGLKGEVKLGNLLDMAPANLMSSVGNMSKTINSIRHNINIAKNWTRATNALGAVENLTKGTFFDGLLDAVKNTKLFG